jgi:hypothetical protein
MGEGIRPLMALMNIEDPGIRIAANDIRGLVRRAIVNDDLLPIRIGLTKNALDTRADKVLVVVRRRDDAYERRGNHKQ